MRLSRNVSLAIAAGAVVFVPTAVVAGIGAADSQPARALMAATAWQDWVSGQRTPQVVASGDTESAIIILDGAAISDVESADRAGAVTRIQADQLAVEAEVQGLGGVVTHRYRTLINGLAVRVPTGHLAAVGEIKGISAVVPVRYLAPAAATAVDPVATADGASGAEVPATGSGPPAHVALIDAGVDASHPWLGGGIGANRLIIGGQDLVDVDADPSPDPADPAAEAHGTQMASIVLRSPALSGLPPTQIPRLLAYRVTAREMVDGQVRTLARSDRVLAALEMAADPNRDGMPDDTAQVIVMGLARGFGGSGVDPVALALSAANRAGAVVVVPAGNDGPTNLVPGSVGQPASAPGVLTVGGLSGDSSPRTADLAASVGPAAAALTGLPLLGAAPDGALAAGLPLVLASGSDGVGTGLEVGDFAGPDGRSTVSGAVAMVTRGGAPLAAVARRAASAGAKAIIVWDADGTGAFPGVSAGADAPIPIIGLGSAQGQALVELFRRNPSMSVAVTPRDVTAQPVAVASFSSTGPSALGRLEPQLVAPAVGVEAAYPGRDDASHAQEAPLTGTSAAAAVVAAEALRLRIDHPEWTPADVRSVLVQTTHQVPGAAAVEQGSGAAPDPASIATRTLPGVAFDPPIISGPISRDSDSAVGYTLHDLTGTGGRYRVLMQAEDGSYVSTGPSFDLEPGGRHKGVATIPRGPETGPASYRGRLVVAPVGGEVAAGSAMVWATTRPRTADAALGSPSVNRRGSGIGVLTVRVGMRDALAVGLNTVTLHDLQVVLHPVGSGAPIRMGSAEPSGDWPAARYEISLTKRDARGTKVPAGYYRAVVTATGPDGTVLGRTSAPFRVR
jgi:hypothetical protein